MQHVSSRWFWSHLSCAGLVRFAQRFVSLTSGRQPDDTSERCRDLWKLSVGVSVALFLLLHESLCNWSVDYMFHGSVRMQAAREQHPERESSFIQCGSQERGMKSHNLFSVLFALRNF